MFREFSGFLRKLIWRIDCRNDGCGGQVGIFPKVFEIFPETSGQSSEKVIGIFLKSSVENLGEVPEIFPEFYRFLLMCENCIFRTLNYREFSGDLLAFLLMCGKFICRLLFFSQMYFLPGKYIFLTKKMFKEFSQKVPGNVLQEIQNNHPKF